MDLVCCHGVDLEREKGGHGHHAKVPPPASAARLHHHHHHHHHGLRRSDGREGGGVRADTRRDDRKNSSRARRGRRDGDETRRFEGDILPTENEIRTFYGAKAVKRLRGEGVLPSTRNNRDRDRRGRRRDKTDTSLVGESQDSAWTARLDYRWTDRGGPNGLVRIPYAFRDGDYSAAERKTIVDAITDLAKRSGVVEFVPRTTETDYVLVKDTDGCASYVGDIHEGPQTLNLHHTGCLYAPGVVQHEFLHALGFFHEQSRADRDAYVKVNLENVRPSAMSNFLTEKDDVDLGAPYDYGSVMHYGRTEFSRNGKETITPLKNGGDVEIGQRQGASETDLTLVRLLYQCVSGPRRLEEYKASPCTSDCKCWEGARGCVEDDACQGDMTCRDKICQRSKGKRHEMTVSSR